MGKKGFFIESILQKSLTWTFSALSTFWWSCWEGLVSYRSVFNRSCILGFQEGFLDLFDGTFLLQRMWICSIHCAPSCSIYLHLFVSSGDLLFWAWSVLSTYPSTIIYFHPIQSNPPTHPPIRPSGPTQLSKSHPPNTYDKYLHLAMFVVKVLIATGHLRPVPNEVPHLIKVIPVFAHPLVGGAQYFVQGFDLGNPKPSMAPISFGGSTYHSLAKNVRNTWGPEGGWRKLAKKSQRGRRRFLVMMPLPPCLPSLSPFLSSLLGCSSSCSCCILLLFLWCCWFAVVCCLLLVPFLVFLGLWWWM